VHAVEGREGLVPTYPAVGSMTLPMKRIVPESRSRIANTKASHGRQIGLNLLPPDDAILLEVRRAGTTAIHRILRQTPPNHEHHHLGVVVVRAEGGGHCRSSLQGGSFCTTSMLNPRSLESRPWSITGR